MLSSCPDVVALDPASHLESDRAADAPAPRHDLTELYPDLRAIAWSLMQRERRGHTLQPTAVVNETYLRLERHCRATGLSRSHLLAIAADEMRRVLIDHARRRRALKAGGAWARVELHDACATTRDAPDLVALDDALRTLEALNPRWGRIVSLRYFGGLTIREVADLLDLSPKTINQDWSFARAWLCEALREAS